MFRGQIRDGTLGGRGQLSFTNLLSIRVAQYIFIIHHKIIYGLTFPSEVGRIRFMLGGISSSCGLQLSKLSKGIMVLGSPAGNIDDCISPGLVPGTLQTLKMSPKAVSHWLSSMSACFGTHEYHSARVRIGLPAVYLHYIMLFVS